MRGVLGAIVSETPTAPKTSINPAPVAQPTSQTSINPAPSPKYSVSYDIFLSYRRDGGEAMAILLRDRLVAKGYNVFLDIENLNSGTFNNRLFDVIDNCKDFVLICSKDSLDRCANNGDWVRLEIARALNQRKNIVPIMLRGFEFPDVLPTDIEAVRMHNGVNANSHEYFDAAIDRMAEKFFISKPNKNATSATTERAKKKLSIAKVLIPVSACLALIACGYFYMNIRNDGQSVNASQPESATASETETDAPDVANNETQSQSETDAPSVVNDETQPLNETAPADTSDATAITLSPEELLIAQEEAIAQAVAEAMATANISNESPSQSDAPNVQAETVSDSFKVGDIIKFGEYEWRVLFMKDGKALIITENVILKRKYDGLLDYLNSEDFMYITFSAQEQERMIDTNLTDLFEKKEKAYKLIFLTRDQINLYFDDEEDRIATYNGKKYSWWFFEKSNGYTNYVRIITAGGNSDSYVTNAGSEDGVRPAIWINY